MAKRDYKTVSEWKKAYRDKAKLMIIIKNREKLIDKISGQAKQGAVYYIIYLSR